MPVDAGRKVVWAHVEGSSPAEAAEDVASSRRGR
jgi:hypothetical protein